MPIELLAPAVLLDHHVGNFIDSFVCGEAAFAPQALAPAADGFAFLAFPRIHHLVFHVVAKRTLQSAVSRPRRRRPRQSSPSLTASPSPNGTTATKLSSH